jgi:DNA excision repair protein ERCC-3
METLTFPRLANPLIVQGDHTVLVEVDRPRYAEARDELVGFAELVKSPEHVHTYRITALSIWNARAAGLAPERIVAALEEYAKYPVPEHVTRQIRDYANRYGRLKLERDGDALLLVCDDPVLAEEVSRHRAVSPLLAGRSSDLAFHVSPADRGRLKQALVRAGYPAEDLAGYTDGEALSIALRERMRDGSPFELRAYQAWAVRAFHAAGSARGGSGVIVLPCGAGKTVVGVACMAELSTSTLILTTSVTASRQWAEELADKSSLDPGLIGLYDGTSKEIRPVTMRRTTS